MQRKHGYVGELCSLEASSHTHSLITMFLKLPSWAQTDTQTDTLWTDSDDFPSSKIQPLHCSCQSPLQPQPSQIHIFPLAFGIFRFSHCVWSRTCFLHLTIQLVKKKKPTVNSTPSSTLLIGAQRLCPSQQQLRTF